MSYKHKQLNNWVDIWISLWITTKRTPGGGGVLSDYRDSSRALKKIQRGTTFSFKYKKLLYYCIKVFSNTLNWIIKTLFRKSSTAYEVVRTCCAFSGQIFIRTHTLVGLDFIQIKILFELCFYRSFFKISITRYVVSRKFWVNIFLIDFCVNL